MKRWMTLGLIVTAFSGLAVGCGDDDEEGGDSSKCKEAEQIMKDCGQEFDGSECSADAQAVAECIIKYPDGACTDELSQDAIDFASCASGGQ
jgi:hypothetical protein